MPRQLTGRGPVQRRVYVPDLEGVRREFAGDFSRVEVTERGPDVELRVCSEHYTAGVLKVDKDAELLVVRRLFGEAAPREDRAAFQALLQTFEDAVLSQEPQRVVLAWRHVMAVLDAMARDLAALEAPR